MNRHVVALQLEYPDKVWSADDFAKKIGCTGAAVRKTQAWKEYQERLENERHERTFLKGNRGRRGSFEDFDADDNDDFEV